MPFFRPTYLIDGDLTDIDLDRLAQDGIKGLLLDLDSTLLAPKSGKLTPAVESWLQAAKMRFQLAVVSNNRKDPYIKQAEKLLAIPVFGRAKKPCTAIFKKALADFNLDPPQVAVVGDRPLTDIWGGQRAGMKTILVLPLKTINEPGWKTFLRKLERCFIRA